LNNGTDTITIQDTKYDEAGHVIENKKHKYILPYGFKTIKTSAINTEDKKDIYTEMHSGDEDPSGDAFSSLIYPDGDPQTVADNTQDTIEINPGNKWI
jgi:hypothetical protein